MSGHRDISPEQWLRVERLVDRLVDGEDYRKVYAEEPDPEVQAVVERLWSNDEEAARSRFLEEHLPLIVGLNAEMQPIFSNGQNLIGRFRIERLLGIGGMGEVYLAFDDRLQQKVAIKTIRRDLATDEAVCRHFLAEVQNARRVTHPNVCRINEIFDDNATPFLSMELLDGPHLSDWLRGGARPHSLARDVAMQLAEGLSAAHRSGVVHGDFKPSNVILSGEAPALRVVITDFGLARALYSQTSKTAQQLSIYSLRGGTRRYMAPELLSGGTPDVASDIFAYGRVLEQLLPGHRLAAACTASRREHRPASLDVAVKALGQGHNRRIWMLLAAAAGISGWSVYYGSPSRLSLSGRRRVAVNGFRSEDHAQSLAVRQLFLIALRQWPSLMVMGDERIRTLLGSLHYPRALPVDTKGLLALAAREGALAIDGALKQEGDRLRLSLQLFAEGNDRPVVSIEQDVPRVSLRNQLVEQTATQLRRHFDETAGALPPPGYLDRFTSSSSLALDYYFRGLNEMQKPNPENAIVMLEKAVEQDPKFAVAQMQLGVALTTNDRIFDALPHYRTAFALSKSTSERERLWIEGRYYNIVGDFERSSETCKTLALLYPDEATFQQNAAFAATRFGRPMEALPLSQRAMELDPDNENLRSEWLVNQCDANLYDRALEEYRRFRSEGRTSTLLDWGAGIAHTGRGEFDDAISAFDRMISSSEVESRVRWAHLLRCIPLIASGRWRQAAFELTGDIAYDAATAEQLRQPTRRYWLGMLYVLLDSPALACPQAEFLCGLDPLPVMLQPIEEGALLALEIGENALAAQALDRLRSIDKNWHSTHSQGASALIQGLSSRDPRGALAPLMDAMGLWTDPITLYAVGRFQNISKNFEGALNTLNSLEEARGRAYRLFFPGLVFLGRIERARALAGMSRFAESFRLYGQVLKDFGDRIPSCALKDQLLSEYRGLPHYKGANQ